MLYAVATLLGFYRAVKQGKVSLMTLIQIGVTRQKTVLEYIQELSDRQSSEIQQLKQSALERAGRKRHRARKSHLQHAT